MQRTMNIGYATLAVNILLILYPPIIEKLLVYFQTLCESRELRNILYFNIFLQFLEFIKR